MERIRRESLETDGRGRVGMGQDQSSTSGASSDHGGHDPKDQSMIGSEISLLLLGGGSPSDGTCTGDEMGSWITESSVNQSGFPVSNWLKPNIPTVPSS